jgi:excisionase family DNA binding protein
MALHLNFASNGIVPPLKTKEAAAYLRMAVRTLLRYVKRREIACSKTNAYGHYLFTMADLDDFMARRRLKIR